MKNLTDEELMILVSNDNLDMMSILFDRYHIRIFNFLLKMTRDRDISQDITQEVFYKAIKYRKSYKKGKFSSWIYTIARNIFSDHYQRQKNKDQRLDEIEYKVERQEIDTIEKVEIKEQLNKALRELNPSDRELVIMNRYQGIKYQEIAEITGSTAGAVKTKVHRAIHKLKDCYLQNI
ncbi:RNA polymerase sigma-70 factor, ECF subfamily [Aquimarina amphilecti]|uniref:RNA polymerase sigma-70 factor, ECF subfamily n=1 Tax=Aquimarina amphilecti TaxID=1038014 RepID=A0A1H7KIB8_AQUAM|nr:RNA polymerase sigma factor [Aquimarina amphilecti]SEK86522.1 RNA polymerase sigma-70 factor, ECF subfamily [Aquimarina amphilecti]